MKDESYWNVFQGTGSVRDYLKYKEKVEQGWEFSSNEGAGDYTGAGISDFDRHDFEGDTYR